jgi:hypothetical protein
MTTVHDPAMSSARPAATPAQLTEPTHDGQLATRSARDGDPPYGASDEVPAVGPQNRATLVAAAANRWVSELAGLNGRDPLLHYRDLKVGTLDLASADPDNRKRLLDGNTIAISRLFPHEPLRSSALRTARKIRDGARELAQEHGVEAVHLVVGIATWANPYAAHRPSVPVLLRSASIQARDPAETDFVVTVAEAAGVNPMLLDAMDRQLGLRFTIDDLRDPDGQLRYPGVVERLREFAPPHVVDGFSIEHRAVLGRFAREPLAQAADVRHLSGEFGRNDVVAALAGDQDAAAALWQGSGTAVRPKSLILEADPAQRDAIAAIAGGGNVCIEAPPGTGRTQTIAAAAAELVAAGRRVLVISSKRASLRDLKLRLYSAGLGDLVADATVRGAADSMSEQMAEAVTTAAAGVPVRDAVAGAEAPSPTTPPGSLVQAYLDALHRRRDPWGTSAHQVMAALSMTPPEIRADTRFSAEALQQLGGASIEALRTKLSEYARLGGLSPQSADSPWRTAQVPTEQSARAVREALRSLCGSTLPALKDMATRAAVEVGLAGPATAAEALATIDLLDGVASTQMYFLTQIWDTPIEDFADSTARRGHRGGRVRGLIARRRLRLQVIDLLRPDEDRPDRDQLHGMLASARDQLAAWREKSRDGRPPRTGEHLPTALTVATAMRDQLATIVAVDPSAEGLVELPFGEARRRLDTMARAEDELMALPRRTQLGRELQTAGLDEVVQELRDGPIPADQAAAALTYAWQVSLLDLWRGQDAALLGADPAQLEADLLKPTDEDGDRARAVARARAGRARAFAALVEDHEGEVSVVESAGAGPVAVRDLVSVSPEVVTTALPIWLASPLTVPMLLPPRRLFDVTIIDDAGLVPPAHAVSALARSDSVVLFADAEQVPPAAFVTTDATPEDVESGPPSALPQSVADALAEALPRLPLKTQHRVRDDRLVRFASESVYGGRMTLLPAAYEPARLRHDMVAAGDGQDSSEAEVARVVELVLEHARNRPHESLGVVTLSGPHASRVETALRAALIRNPDVAPLLDDVRAEPFFIKDVTRVAGDVRDAIILTLGFGRSVDGRVLYRFGALDRPGGERRLAAAITRSRERTTVVSCFGADDLSPRRLTTPGGQALREFLAYAAAPWQPAGDARADPLADAIARRLEVAGASVVRAYGDPSGQVEIAVRHPKRRERMVLAVETDGGRGGGQQASWRQNRLRRLGWSVHRVWSAAWSADPDREAARLVKAYKQAVAAADAYDWGVAAVEADIVAGIPNDDDTEAKSTGKNGKARKPKKRGPRPHVPAGRPISAYARQELAATAAWVETDGLARTEDEVMAELVRELKPLGPSARPDGDARTSDILRYAVRLARAGGAPE